MALIFYRGSPLEGGRKMSSDGVLSHGLPQDIFLLLLLSVIKILRSVTQLLKTFLICENPASPGGKIVIMLAFLLSN